LAYRIQVALEKEIAPEEILRDERPLLDVIEEGARASDRGQESTVVAMSEIELGLWYDSARVERAEAYTLRRVYELTDGLSLSAIEQACRVLLHRHSRLRASVVVSEEGPQFIINDEVEWKQQIFSVDVMARDDQSADAVDNFLNGPIMATQERLFYVLIVRVGPSCVVALKAHHMIVDFASVCILLDELCGALTGVEFNRLGSQDGLESRRSVYRQSQQCQLDRVYWRSAYFPKRRDDVDSRSPRSDTGRSEAGDCELMEVSLPASTVDRLRKSAQGVRMSLQELVFAAFYDAARVFDRDREPLVGVTLNERRFFGGSDEVGYMVNLLPICTRIRTEAGLMERLEGSVLGLREAIIHGRLPLVSIAEAQAGDSGRREQLRDIQIVYNYLGRSPTGKTGDLEELCFGRSPFGGKVHGLNVRVLRQLPARGRHRLTMSVVQSRGGGLHGTLEYDTGTYTAQQMRAALRRMEQSLNTIVGAKVVRFTTNPEEGTGNRRGTPPWRFRGLTRKIPSENFVTERLAWFGSQSSATVAIDGVDGTLTYAELWSSVASLAEKLCRDLDQEAMLIPILLASTSRALPVAIAGVLLSGRGYVPLDMNWPQEQIENVIRRLGRTVVITCAALAPKLGRIADCHIIDMDLLSLGEAVPRSRKSAVKRMVEMDALAYAIATSGTTGESKLAIVNRRGMNNTLRWFIDTFKFDATDRGLRLTSPAFDLTQKALLAPLLTGGRLLLGASTFDPVKLVRLIARDGISWLNCTPSIFHNLIAAASKDDYRSLVSLKHVFLGGEPLQPATVAPWLASSNCRAKVVNTYGPAECADVCCYHVLEPRDMDADAVIPIGRPIWNVTLSCRDLQGRPTTTGEGELWIHGAAVGEGYLADRPETAAKFVRTSVSEPGEIAYRTGDLVRIRADRRIEFVSRLDGQVKICGIRVEPSQVEAVLVRHAAVSAAGVVPNQGQHSGDALVAFVVAKDGSFATSTQDVKSWLRERLPEAMVPSQLVEVATLPTTANGKLDRAALAAKQLDRVNSQRQATQEIELEVEQALSSAWCEELNVDTAERHADFFHLGGTSLMAIRIVSHLTTRLGGDIPLTIFFSGDASYESVARETRLAIHASRSR
jgi:amino acid adenylation domain-containing protein